MSGLASDPAGVLALPELARPWVLLALLLLPVWGLVRWRAEGQRHVVYPPLQFSPMRQAGGAHLRALQWLPLATELLCLTLLLVALAGPYRGRDLTFFEDEGIDVALVLDVSLSMLAEDFPPTRLEALRGAARDFIHRAGSNRVGLVIFAKDVYVQAPLTSDHTALLSLLDGITPYTLNQAKSGGTAVGDALLVAADQLARHRREGRDQALVLITDGESNSGAEPTLAARYARHLEQRLYILGIGGTEPVEVFFDGERVGSGDAPYLAVLDDAALQELAEAGEGRYFRATDTGSLEAIFTELSRLETAPLEARTVEIRTSLAPRLALGGFLLLGLQVLALGTLGRRPFR